MHALIKNKAIKKLINRFVVLEKQDKGKTKIGYSIRYLS